MSGGPYFQHALYDLAEALAYVVHDGQVRKGTGEAYFGHVERVAERVSDYGWRAQTIAFLHDVIEDTPVTPWTLILIGFPADIANDVMALSRQPDETYFDFIERTIRTGSDDALRVKLADLADNLSDDWLKGQGSLRDRYVKSDARIRQALIERGAEVPVFHL